MTVARCLDKVEVAAVLLALILQSNGILNLVVFELNGRIVLIAIGMVLGEDFQGFLRALLGNQPTRGLGNPPEEAELSERWDTLDEGDGSPGPVVADVDGAEADKGANCYPMSVSSDCRLRA